MSRAATERLLKGPLQSSTCDDLGAHPAVGMVASPSPENLGEQIARIADDTVALVGGKTLPVPCSISAMSWQVPLEMRGKIAPKPDPVVAPPIDVTVLCCIDGFIRSKRTVFPSVTPVDKRKSQSSIGVSFDENEWLDRIVASACRTSQHFEAVYAETVAGAIAKRTLKSLTPVDGAAVLVAKLGNTGS